jgi:aspartyl-tRNA(Asn)/glutamyl-tRNA(Gln) amidotransferase subunit A
MALNVEDCAILLDAISGYDPADPESTPRPTAENYHNAISQPIDGLRFAIPKNHFFESIDPDVHLAVLDAVKVFEKLGAKVCEVSFPGVEEDVKVSSVIRLAEGAAIHHRDLVERRSEIGADVLERLEMGSRFSAIEYILARRTQASKTRMRAEFFHEYDLLLTPTIPIEPPLIEGTDSIQAAAKLPSLTVPFNLVGVPAISIPCGFSRGGLPVGLQLVAGHWNEAKLLRAAHAYEKGTDWAVRKPDL